MNSSKQPTSPLSLAYTDKTQMLVTATPLEHWSVVMVTVKHNELQQPADLPTVPGQYRQTDNKTQMLVTATPLEHWSVVMVTVKHNELQQAADLPTVPGLHRQQDPDASNSHIAECSWNLCQVLHCQSRQHHKQCPRW